MVKAGLILFSCLVMLLALITNGAQRVVLDPSLYPPFNVPLGLVMLAFFVMGACLCLLLALIDRAELTSKNRRLTKQLGQLETELSSLRQMMTVEQESE